MVRQRVSPEGWEGEGGGERRGSEAGTSAMFSQGGRAYDRPSDTIMPIEGEEGRRRPWHSKTRRSRSDSGCISER